MFTRLKIKFALISIAMIVFVFGAVFVGLNLHMSWQAEIRLESARLAAESAEGLDKEDIEKRFDQLEALSSNSTDFLDSLLNVSLVIAAISLLPILLVSLLLAQIAIKPIQAAWQKQQLFVADASHELRSPLAAISTNLDVVLESPEESVEQQSQWLHNIKNETSCLSKLVNDLLFLARSDSKGVLMNFESVLLGKIIESACEPYQKVMKEKKIDFTANIQSGIHTIGDSGRIVRLAIILLDNAIKHTPPGGKISVRLYKRNDKACFEVQDTGVGIEEQYQRRIFERFYRVDRSRSRSEGSFGLGLSIAKSIVLEHKGVIDVNSQIGNGTTFMVQFPLASK